MLPLFLFVSSLACLTRAEQFYYTQSTTEDCVNPHPENSGYLCSSTQPSCDTLAYFRVHAPQGSYTSLSRIAVSLFNTTASSIMNANDLASEEVLVGHGLYIPMSCGCYGDRSSYNITHAIEAGETFFVLSNTTYQGLTTCQAVQDANPDALATNLQIGQKVILPIRCACPSADQISNGIQSLVTYPVADGDNIHYVVTEFGIRTADFLEANNISDAHSPLFPATTVLLPFPVKPRQPPNGTSVSSTVFPLSPQLSSLSQSGSSGTAGKRSSATAAIAGGIAVLILLLPVMISYTWWRRHNTQDNFFDVPAEEDPEVHLGQLRRFSLRELQAATGSFNRKNLVGRGGFGKVYKGRLADGSLVAVKRLKGERSRGGELQFQFEVEMISMAAHRNLLLLRGFCMTPTERLLVYPFMSNGSVSSRLRDRAQGTPALEWNVRKRIALGAARGLAYLHEQCDPKIIHRDVKAANILLDDEFEAVIGDFGLAKLIDYKDTHVTTAVRGTIGHIAPEYLSTGKSSEKTDVFGFGITLLELMTGQRAFDPARDGDVMLLDWVKDLLNEQKIDTLIDPDLKPEYHTNEVERLIHVALLCTQSLPSERPKMSEVVRMLEGDGLAEHWEEWQKAEVERSQVEGLAPAQCDWILHSVGSLHAVELSGPR